MKRLAIIAALCVAAPAVAQPAPKPPLVLPKSTRVAPGKLARIACETAAKKVTWRLPPGVDAEQLDGGVKLVCTAPAGTYTLSAAVPDAEGGVAFADMVLVVEPETPAPPPAPVPPPEPTDPFMVELRRLLAADPAPDKGERAKDLAALYRQAAKLAGDKDKFATAGALMDAVADAARTFAADALRGARERVLMELRAIARFDPESPLTPELRARVAAVYSRAAGALDP